MRPELPIRALTLVCTQLPLSYIRFDFLWFDYPIFLHLDMNMLWQFHAVSRWLPTWFGETCWSRHFGVNSDFLWLCFFKVAPRDPLALAGPLVFYWFWCTVGWVSRSTRVVESSWGTQVKAVAYVHSQMSGNCCDWMPNCSPKSSSIRVAGQKDLTGFCS